MSSTVFTLEAVFAKKGDALLLHYGPWEQPSWILIDGGPRGVYNKFLAPRLAQLREEFEMDADDAIPLEMVMVSHIDDDHVAGVIDLFEDLQEAKDAERPPPYRIGSLWHNSFDDLLDNDEEEIVSRMAATAESKSAAGGLPIPKMTRESRAVVASTKQGRDLRNLAKKLKVKVNKPFKGLVMAPAAKEVELGHGLTFTVVGPVRARVEAYQKEWDKDLKKILEKQADAAEAASFSDKSPFNLASICVLAQMKKGSKRRKMLLTGDARGDFLIEGLEKAGLLKKNKPMRVDILKVPHHGSDRNVETGFFERIEADHYVVSGDGEHGNPEVATLDMIAAAREDDEYTIHFTFTENAWKSEKNKKRKAALKKVQRWVDDEAPDGCTVRFREDEEDIYSLCVDLLDPLYAE